MVKVNGPLLSKTASGSIAKRLTFSQRKSGQQVRFQRAQKDVITSNRTTQRAWFLSAVSAWNLLTPQQKAPYNEIAKDLNMSGYNYYISKYVPPVPMPAGLFCHYLLNDFAENSSVADTFNLHNCTANQNTNVISDVGKIEKCLTFNGSSDCLFPENPFLLPAVFSISLWLFPFVTPSPTYGALFSDYQDLGIFFITGHAWSSACDYQACFYVGGDKGYSAKMPAGSWANLIITFDNGNVDYYVNNSLAGSVSASGCSPFNVNRIGNDPIGEAFFGKKDDIRFYNRKLTADDRALIFNNGIGTERE